MKKQDLDRYFTYHPPVGNQPKRYERIRAMYRQLAEELNDLVGECREKNNAFTKLRESVMWANAGIACEQQREENADA